MLSRVIELRTRGADAVSRGVGNVLKMYMV
jgi:hypothetical protein